MTETEALALLTACKPLAERICATTPGGVALNYTLTKSDMEALQGFDQVQKDPLAAGPGLLGKLVKTAGLTQVEIYKLDQLRRLVFNRRYTGKFTNRYSL